MVKSGGAVQKHWFWIDAPKGKVTVNFGSKLSFTLSP